MSEIVVILRKVREEGEEIAEQSFKEHTSEARADTEDFLQFVAPQLELLSKGQIGVEEFATLVQDSGQMWRLREAGFPRLAIDTFVSRLTEFAIRLATTGTDSPGPAAIP